MRYFLFISYALILGVFLSPRTSCKADDSPGFFLKITKNVPRLGRRTDKQFEGAFMKNYKTIPRIGRSVDSDRKFSFLYRWLQEPLSKSVNKRVLMSPIPRLAAERELSVVQPVNSNTLMELLDKDAIPSDNVKFVHWKDFDRALQLDNELYGKVISLGRKPDQRLKEDITVGSYIPLIEGNTLDSDGGGDFMLYNRMEGPYASDFLHYSRV